jgi:hypothetical protein
MRPTRAVRGVSRRSAIGTHSHSRYQVTRSHGLYRCSGTPVGRNHTDGWAQITIANCRPGSDPLSPAGRSGTTAGVGWANVTNELWVLSGWTRSSMNGPNQARKRGVDTGPYFSEQRESKCQRSISDHASSAEGTVWTPIAPLILQWARRCGAATREPTSRRSARAGDFVRGCDNGAHEAERQSRASA